MAMAFGFGPHNDNFDNGNFPSEPVEREFSSSILLEKLYIHNFKSFYDSTFEFGKLNCLIAPNNTGKSNLIDALKFLDGLIYHNPARAFAKIGRRNIQNYHHIDDDIMMLTAYFRIHNRVLVGEEFFEYDIGLVLKFNHSYSDKKSNTDIWINGKVKSVIVDKADLKNAMALRVFGGFDEYINNYPYYCHELQKKRFEKFKLWYNDYSLNYSINEARLPKTIASVHNLFGLVVKENNETLIKPIDLRLIFNRHSLFASHYFHAHDIKRMQQAGFDYFLEDGTNLAEYLSGLDQATFEDISTALIGEVELLNGIGLNKGFTTDVIFNEEVNDKRNAISIQDVSDGSIHFIALMTAILGNRNSIGLLIEEPERHMHMKVLSYILNTMRDDDKQIFFTTHSTEFLMQLNLDEVIFMFRDYEGDTKSQRAEDIPNIKKFMKRYKNDLVEMIKYGVVGEYEE